MTKNQTWLVVLALATVFGIILPSVSRAVLCGTSRIRDYDAEYCVAQNVLGREFTSDPLNVKVYVTFRDGYWYFHSNFKHRKAEFPIKLAEPFKVFDDLEGPLKNLIFFGSEVEAKMSPYLMSDLVKSTEFFVDGRLFDAEGNTRFRRGEASNIFHVDSGGHTTKLFPSGSNRPPPFFAEISPNLRVKLRNNVNPWGVTAKFNDTRFSREKFSFLNLIPESAVENALAPTQLAKYAKNLQISSEAGLFDVVRQNKDKTLAALFHCDGENMILENESGKTIMSVPLKKLTDAASEVNCTLIALGCTAGKNSVMIGPQQAFNPVDAIHSLNNALMSTTLAEFGERLTGGKFQMVFDSTLLPSQHGIEQNQRSDGKVWSFIAQLPMTHGEWLTPVVPLVGVIVFPSPPSREQSGSNHATTIVLWTGSVIALIAIGLKFFIKIELK